jgi:hypothetical protein
MSASIGNAPLTREPGRFTDDGLRARRCSLVITAGDAAVQYQLQFVQNILQHSSANNFRYFHVYVLAYPDYNSQLCQLAYIFEFNSWVAFGVRVVLTLGGRVGCLLVPFFGRGGASKWSHTYYWSFLVCPISLLVWAGTRSNYM